MKVEVFKKAALLFLVVATILFVGCDEEESPFGGSQTFIKLFGSTGDDVGQQVIFSGDGGYALIGTIDQDIDGLTLDDLTIDVLGRMYVAKTDDEGNEIWAKSFLDSTATSGASIQLTSDGNFMALGTVFEFDSTTSTGNADMLLMKISNSGDSLWSKRFSFANQLNSIETGQHLRLTRDGGFILIGTTLAVPLNNNGLNMYVVKVDAEGNRQWERSYGFDEGQNDFGTGVLEANNGDFIWMGSAEVNRTGETDMRAVRSNTIGNLIWDFRYGDSGNDRGIDVQSLADGFIMAGKLQLGNDRAYLVRIDNNGQVLWEQNYQIGTSDEATAVASTQDGGFILTGGTFSSGNREDILLLKTDESGQLEWSQQFGGAGQDQGSSVLATSDGGYLICGTLQFENTRMICLIKTDAEGKLSETE